MLLLATALIAFGGIGWDTWDGVAFVPWDAFTHQGLAWVLAQRHPMLWVSLGAFLGGLSALRHSRHHRPWLYLAAPLLLISVLAALWPSVGARQVDLGIGATVYCLTLLCCCGQVGAAFGWMRGDRFSAATTLVGGVLIVTFIFFPIALILREGVGTLVQHITTYGHLATTYWNTLQLALLTSLTTTLLALSLALVVVRSRFRRVGIVLKQISLLPLLTPPFVIGLSLIFLFGRSGLITNQMLGVSHNFIFGLPGLLIAQTLSFLPPALLVIVSALDGMDATLEEASHTLHADYGVTLRRVTWPLLRPAVANAFLLTIMESFADFANPMVIGGDYRVLSTEIYFAVIGKYDLPQAASLGTVLLLSTLLFFLLHHLWLGQRSYVTVTGKPQARVLPTLPRRFDTGLTAVCGLLGLLTLCLYLFFFYGSFVKIWGIDATFTLDNYRLFWVDAKGSLMTTLLLSLLAAPFTALLGLLLAYVIQRKTFVGRRSLEFLALLAFAIPGTVVGMGYLVAFHNPPFALTGSAMILMLCFIFRNMPIGMRAGVSALTQIDRSLEDASLTMGASTATTLRRILLPLGQGAVITAVTTSFVRAITAVSAVVFLVSAQHNLATRVILDRVEYGKLGIATAYCVVLLGIMGLSIAVSQWVIRRVTGPGAARLTEQYAAH